MADPGFRLEDEEGRVIDHPLTHPFNSPQIRPPRVHANTSSNFAVRTVRSAGFSFLAVEIHPDDVHGALRAWLRVGASKEVEFLADLDAEGGVRCSLYADTDEELSLLMQRHWYQDRVPVRLVPRQGVSLGELLDEVIAAW